MKNYDYEDKKLREQLAELCHEQWSEWMKYLFSKTFYDMGSLDKVDKDNGNLFIPKKYVKRWKRQANTVYEDLPENEKESDRKEADRFMNIMKKDNKHSYNEEYELFEQWVYHGGIAEDEDIGTVWLGWQGARQWLSTKNVLPENGSEVLIIDSEVTYHAFYQDKMFLTVDDQPTFTIFEIEYWYPVPELPKENNNG